MKRTIKFTSLNPAEYPDVEMEFDVVEDCNDIASYTDQKKFWAKKEATIKARKAVEGERVVTGPMVTIDGKVYRFVEADRLVTQQHAADGAMVITNPDGEVYFNNTEAKFVKGYGEIKNDGVEAEYKSAGKPLPFVTATRNVVIMKPDWGEGAFQVVPEGSKINVAGNAYSIVPMAFESTYVPCAQPEPELGE